MERMLRALITSGKRTNSPNHPCTDYPDCSHIYSCCIYIFQFSITYIMRIVSLQNISLRCIVALCCIYNSMSASLRYLTIRSRTIRILIVRSTDSQCTDDSGVWVVYA